MATKKVTVTLDGVDATSVGILLGATGTRDIADAHVVVCAKRAGEAIVTSDPDDLRRLDPSASLVRIRRHGPRSIAMARSNGATTSTTRAGTETRPTHGVLELASGSKRTVWRGAGGLVSSTAHG